MYMERVIIAEATFQKQKMKGFCYGITPILESSTGYGKKKRSHNRMIDSHWAWKHIALKHI